MTAYQTDPEQMSESGFKLMHDQGRPLCFVGFGTLSSLIQHDFPRSASISLEDLVQQPNSYFDNNQFIVITSDVAFKQKAVAEVSSRGGVFFSLVHENNRICPSLESGRGCFLDCYNQSLPHDDVKIGDHCFVSSFIMLGHRVRINDFCHISAHCFLSWCELGQGTVVGVASKIVGDKKQNVQIADYCNIIMGSTVTKSISTRGTYYDNRRSLPTGSLEHRIL